MKIVKWECVEDGCSRWVSMKKSKLPPKCPSCGIEMKRKKGFFMKGLLKFKNRLVMGIRG
jgi:hypothetical protein